MSLGEGMNQGLTKTTLTSEIPNTDSELGEFQKIT